LQNPDEIVIQACAATMDTVEPANKLLKQHMRALAAIVADGEISDPFHLQRTLNGIHRTFQNDGKMASD
jgi:hypothetical protein